MAREDEAEQLEVLLERGVCCSLSSRRSLKGWQVAVKRVPDVIGAVVGLVVLGPVLALMAMAVKLDSRVMCSSDTSESGAADACSAR